MRPGVRHGRGGGCRGGSGLACHGVPGGSERAGPGHGVGGRFGGCGRLREEFGQRMVGPDRGHHLEGRAPATSPVSKPTMLRSQSAGSLAAERTLSGACSAERRFIALRPPPPRSKRPGASIAELRGWNAGPLLLNCQDRGAAIFRDEEIHHLAPVSGEVAAHARVDPVQVQVDHVLQRPRTRPIPDQAAAGGECPVDAVDLAEVALLLMAGVGVDGHAEEQRGALGPRDVVANGVPAGGEAGLLEMYCGMFLLSSSICDQVLVALREGVKEFRPC